MGGLLNLKIDPSFSFSLSLLPDAAEWLSLRSFVPSGVQCAIGAPIFARFYEEESTLLQTQLRLSAQAFLRRDDSALLEKRQLPHGMRHWPHAKNVQKFERIEINIRKKGFVQRKTRRIRSREWRHACACRSAS